MTRDAVVVRKGPSERNDIDRALLRSNSARAIPGSILPTDLSNFVSVWRSIL